MTQGADRTTKDDMEPGADLRSNFALPRPSRTLTALTTSALALPGIAAPAGADAPIERATAESSFSYYFEDNLSPGDFLDDGVGSRDRFEVYTTQLRFDLPVSKRMDLGIDFLYEDMSGASPWFVVAEAGTGKPLQVMSGATIDDTRFDAAVDLDFYMDNGKDTMTGGVSLEKDYSSFHMGLGAERNYNDRNTVFNTSLAFSHDWVNPTDSDGDITRPGSDTKWGIDLFAGISQILSRASIMQVTVNYKHSQGFLNDPYKLVATVGPADPRLSDERPDTHEQVSILLRYRHHFEAINGSAHADYRFYADDWDVRSHTVELAWYQNIFEWLTFAPTLRWYSQSKADFYEAVLPAGARPSERSSDYRLSPYGAVSLKGKLEVELLDLFEYDPPRYLERIGITEGFDLIAGLSYERYLSDGDFSVRSVSEQDEAPGLVQFQVIAFSLSGRF
jgi:hypothetical protein